MTSPTRVAVVQTRATSDVERNLAGAESLVAAAAGDGAEIALLPEAFTYIGSNEGKNAILEPLPEGGPILDRCRRMAADNGVELVFGFHESGPVPGSDSRSYNTCVHLDAAGAVVATYRKIHLFDVDLADGTRLLESKGTAPGAEPVATETAFGSLGLSVCYDVRFPALYQRLVDMGAIALTVPSAFTSSTGPAHWHVLLRARAIECQAYVLAPAQYGDHEHRNRRSYGHSVIVDPWGEVIAECDDGEGYAIATIDPARVAAVRRELPSLKNRRL